AAVTLARAGASVVVLEAAASIGGGTSVAELTLPGFVHDVCSGAHPMGIHSPFFRQLPLEKHGLEWVQPVASLAHPLDGGPAALLWRSLDRTCRELGRDGPRYRRLIAPLVRDRQALLSDLLAPLRMPEHPGPFLRFGIEALWPATWLASAAFRDEPA